MREAYPARQLDVISGHGSYCRDRADWGRPRTRYASPSFTGADGLQFALGDGNVPVGAREQSGTGFEIDVPVLTVRACGQRYYLAGFAYPLAGTLNLFVAGNSASPVHYLVPTRLSRPRGPGVWQGTG